MKVLGLDDLQKNVDALVKELEQVADPAALAAGEVIADAWRARVPILDENYQRSIAVGTVKGGKVAVGTTWLPDLDRNDQPVLYAKPLEFGNSRTPADPSMRPALAASQEEAVAAAEVPITSVVKGTRKRRRRRATA